MTIGGILLLMLDRKEASQELFLSCGGTGTAGQVHGAGPQGVPFEVCDCKTHTHTHTLYTVNMQQQTIIFHFVMLHFFQEQLLT